MIYSNRSRRFQIYKINKLNDCFLYKCTLLRLYTRYKHTSTLVHAHTCDLSIFRNLHYLNLLYFRTNTGTCTIRTYISVEHYTHLLRFFFHVLAFSSRDGMHPVTLFCLYQYNAQDNLSNNLYNCNWYVLHMPCGNNITLKGTREVNSIRVYAQSIITKTIHYTRIRVCIVYIHHNMWFQYLLLAAI